MKLDRARLAQHLGRIMCGDQITEAVFTGAFATAAITPDEQLLVIAPALAKTKTLGKDPVGIAELKTFGQALQALAGEGDEAVSVEITLDEDNHELTIDEAHRGLIVWPTAAPRTVGTKIDDAVVKKLLDGVATEDALPLTRQLIEGITKTFKLFKATEIEITVGPSGGQIRVGGGNSKRSKFPYKELKAKKEHTLLFGAPLIAVLSVVTNYNEASLAFGGKEGKEHAFVRDGEYQYLVSSKARSKDEAVEKPEAPSE